MYIYVTFCAGTYGQESTWNLGVPTTYQHPIKTRDLLLHVTTPLSASERPDKQNEAVEEDNKDSSTASKKSPVLTVLQAQPAVMRVTEVEEEVCLLL